jgi:hypothetical protein
MTSGFMQRIRKSFFPEIDLGDSTEAKKLLYDDRMPTVSSPIPYELLEQCNFYSTQDISAAIEKDGLCQALVTYSENRIEDPKLSRLWRQAREVLEEVDSYVRRNLYPEIVIEGEIDEEG